MNSPNRLVLRFFALSLVITKSASAQVAERKALTLEGAKKVIAAAEAYASGTMLRRCHRRRGRRWQPDRLIAPPRHFSRRRKYFDKEGPDGGHVPPNKLSEVAASQRKAFQSTSGKEVEFRRLDAAPV